MILETSFIVAAERDAKRRVSGAADEFLAAHPRQGFFITFTIAGELACGRFVAAFEGLEPPVPAVWILPWTRQVSLQYGVIFRELQAAGGLIGTNDLWIAATAMVNRMPVVMANVAEFQRVEGLAVLPF